MKLTYRQAYDRIIEAYFKDEIKPMDSEFCFCGTISPDHKWGCQPMYSTYPYSLREYELMEYALFYGIYEVMGLKTGWCKRHPKSEDALFNGMVKALEVLREIHIERGEDVDQSLSLTKRTLTPC